MSGAPETPTAAGTDQVARTRAMAPPGPAGRMALAGMPVERSENFGRSTKRLLGRLRPERAGTMPA